MDIATNDLCTYQVTVNLWAEGLDTTDILTVEAPWEIDADGLEDLVFNAIKDKLAVISAVNDKEDYRLTKDEIDFYDSAWGYRKGVPEEEFDEELDQEGYYDDYYDEPQYSGYMTNLTWAVTFKYNDIQFVYEVEDDAWKSEDEVIDYAKECVADKFDIISYEVI